MYERSQWITQSLMSTIGASHAVLLKLTETENCH